VIGDTYMHMFPALDVAAQTNSCWTDRQEHFTATNNFILIRDEA